MVNGNNTNRTTPSGSSGAWIRLVLIAGAIAICVYAIRMSQYSRSGSIRVSFDDVPSSYLFLTYDNIDEDSAGATYFNNGKNTMFTVYPSGVALSSKAMSEACMTGYKGAYTIKADELFTCDIMVLDGLAYRAHEIGFQSTMDVADVHNLIASLGGTISAQISANTGGFRYHANFGYNSAYPDLEKVMIELSKESGISNISLIRVAFAGLKDYNYPEQVEAPANTSAGGNN